MLQDWQIDRLLSDITAEITDRIVEQIVLHGGSEFCEKMKSENPASHAYAFEAAAQNRKKALQALAKKFHSYSGYCIEGYGFLEDIAQKRDLKPRIFKSFAMLDDCFMHKAGILKIDTQKGIETYLIDPTFRQFADPDTYPMGRDFWKTPAYRLWESNPQMHDHLMAKGYVELTPDNAEDYLQCFNKDDSKDHELPCVYDAMVNYID